MICLASNAVVFLGIDLSSPLPSPLRVEGCREDKVGDDMQLVFYFVDLLDNER
jgi:hypothetical protein